MTARRLPAALRRTLHLRRRPLAALCAFAAVLAALAVLAPAPVAVVRVWAAAEALPAGTLLGEEHLVPLDLPTALAPADAPAEASALLGRTLGGAVSARSVLTSASVSEGERVAQPGHVVLALPLPNNAIADLVRPGVRLDVLDAAGSVLARDARVVASPGSDAGLTLGSAARSALVEVPEDVAAVLAAQASSSLTVVVR